MIKYGKIINNGQAVNIPTSVKYNGYIYYNPKPEIYMAAGYYPIIELEKPEDKMGKAYKRIYELIDNKIVAKWEEIEIQIKEEESNNIMATISYDDLVVQKIRTQYSINNELAIRRQKEVKPEEYAEYYSFVEQCKFEAKMELELLNI